MVSSRVIQCILMVGICDALRLHSDLSQRAIEQNKKVVQESLRELEQSWPEVDGEHMLKAATASSGAASANKLRKMLHDRFKAKQPFVFAAFGSSVTAGHNNFYNQSWPIQLENILKPVFEKLGFGFEVRNRGLGGWGEAPYSAGCLANRAGAGVDAVSWEFGMFGDSRCERMNFLHEAGDLERKPVVFNMMTHSVKAHEKHREASEAWLMRNNIYQSASRYHEPKDLLSKDLIPEEKMRDWTSPAQMPQGHVMDLAKGCPVSDRRAEERFNSLAGATSKPSQGAEMVNIDVQASQCDLWKKTFYQVREKMMNVNWHPGPIGHYLIASQVAHHMLLAMLESFDDASANFARISGPTADNPVVDQVSDYSGECGELTSKQCWTGNEPNPLVSLANIYESSNKQWKYETSPQQGGHSVDVGHLGHLDVRKTLQGTQSSGSMEFKVNVDTVNDDYQYLLICNSPCGWWCKGQYGYVSDSNNRWWEGSATEAGEVCAGKSKDECKQLLGLIKNGVEVKKRPKVVDFAVNVDGKDIPFDDLQSLNQELFDREDGRYCKECPKIKDMCASVAKLSAGEHKIAIKVDPHSYEHSPEVDSKVTLEIGQVMLVGK